VPEEYPSSGGADTLPAQMPAGPAPKPGLGSRGDFNHGVPAPHPGIEPSHAPSQAPSNLGPKTTASAPPLHPKQWGSAGGRRADMYLQALSGNIGAIGAAARGDHRSQEAYSAWKGSGAGNPNTERRAEERHGWAREAHEGRQAGQELTHQGQGIRNAEAEAKAGPNVEAAQNRAVVTGHNVERSKSNASGAKSHSKAAKLGIGTAKSRSRGAKAQADLQEARLAEYNRPKD